MLSSEAILLITLVYLLAIILTEKCEPGNVMRGEFRIKERRYYSTLSSTPSSSFYIQRYRKTSKLEKAFLRFDGWYYIKSQAYCGEGDFVSERKSFKCKIDACNFIEFINKNSQHCKKSTIHYSRGKDRYESKKRI